METASKAIRDPAFGKRMEQACDANPHCPAHHRGRLGWISEQLKLRFNEKISIETVRKWLAGEVKPGRGRHEYLAQILGVDPVWLFLGVDPEMAPRERKLRNSEADGAVNVVAGLIQMDGGHPAFPEPGDKRAESERIDLYAIIRGANYAFNVSLGYRNAEGSDWNFPAPLTEATIVLGVVREGFAFRIVELTPEIVHGRGKSRVGSSMVTLSDAEVSEMAIDGFTNRL